MPVEILQYSIDSDCGIFLGWDLSHFTLVLPSLPQQIASQLLLIVVRYLKRSALVGVMNHSLEGLSSPASADYRRKLATCFG